MKNAARFILKALGATGLPMVFAACYGAPIDYNYQADAQGMPTRGRVVGSPGGEPLGGIIVSCVVSGVVVETANSSAPSPIVEAGLDGGTDSSLPADGGLFAFTHNCTVVSAEDPNHRYQTTWIDPTATAFQEIAMPVSAK